MQSKPVSVIPPWLLLRLLPWVRALTSCAVELRAEITPSRIALCFIAAIETRTETRSNELPHLASSFDLGTGLQTQPFTFAQRTLYPLSRFPRAQVFCFLLNILF